MCCGNCRAIQSKNGGGQRPQLCIYSRWRYKSIFSFDKVDVRSFPNTMNYANVNRYCWFISYLYTKAENPRLHNEHVLWPVCMNAKSLKKVYRQITIANRFNMLPDSLCVHIILYVECSMLYINKF